MPSPSFRHPARLGLRTGDLVEVRNKEEILATLDEQGRFDSLTFMPEMLALCGRRFTVGAKAEKTCDTVSSSGLRRMCDTVHLEGARCDGSAHGGCQAGCYLFWKEAWLKMVAASDAMTSAPRAGTTAPACDEAQLVALTTYAGEDDESGPRYRCQATLLLEASSPLSRWDLRQYVRDIRARNYGPGRVLKLLFYTLWLQTLRLRGYRLQIATFNALQRLRGGHPWPDLHSTQVKTPSMVLGLQPGEAVRVKSVEEIRDTLNFKSETRGLYFDPEMSPFCERTFRVQRRVSRIINEKTGRMINIPNECIILEGVVCRGHYHQGCPRAIPSYWREAWLERIGPESG